MNSAQLGERFSVLSLRERAFVFAAILVLVLLVSVQFFVLPGLDKQVLIDGRLMQQNLSLTQLKKQNSELRAALLNDPNTQLLNEQAVLLQELSNLEEVFQNKVAALLSPRQTQQLLRDLLSDYHGLRLQGARNIAPREIDIGAKDSASAADDIDVKVFLHGFEMTFTGSYFETMKYIERLEELSGFYWTGLRYEVLEYPKAEVVIGISTLSIKEAWIGG